MTDPGSYTVETQSQIKNLDYILFTHEHQDHYHLESLKLILANNPSVVIYANDGVGALLAKERIAHTIIKHRQEVRLGEVAVLGLGEKHAVVHRLWPVVGNVGFFIDNKLWYPGDAFTDPGRPVEVLALPVAGPWLKLGEAIEYALNLKPKMIFPVHDGTRVSVQHSIPAKILGDQGLTFVPLVEGDTREF